MPKIEFNKTKKKQQKITLIITKTSIKQRHVSRRKFYRNGFKPVRSLHRFLKTCTRCTNQKRFASFLHENIVFNIFNCYFLVISYQNSQKIKKRAFEVSKNVTSLILENSKCILNIQKHCFKINAKQF